MTSIAHNHYPVGLLAQWSLPENKKPAPVQEAGFLFVKKRSDYLVSVIFRVSTVLPSMTSEYK